MDRQRSLKQDQKKKDNKIKKHKNNKGTTHQNKKQKAKERGITKSIKERGGNRKKNPTQTQPQTKASQHVTGERPERHPRPTQRVKQYS